MEPTSQSSARQHKARLLPLGIVAYMFACSAFLGVVSLPFLEKVSRNEQNQILRIRVPDPSLQSAMAIYAGVVLLVLLATGIVCILRRRVLFGAITIVIALSGYCGSRIVAFMVNLSPWTTEAEIRGPDGHTYYFMDSIFWQGQLMAITRLKSNTILTRTMDVQGVTNGDSPRSWASVIRRAGAPENDYGLLRRLHNLRRL